MTSAARLLISFSAAVLLGGFLPSPAHSQPPALPATAGRPLGTPKEEPAEPANKTPQKETPKTALPKWMAQFPWRDLTAPLEEAAVKGAPVLRSTQNGFFQQVAIAGPAGAGGARQMNAVRQREQIEQQIKAMVPQYRQQLRYAMLNELENFRLICTIPENCRREIYDNAEKSFDKAVEEYVRNMYFPTAGRQRGSRVRASVRASVLESLKQHLPASEFSRLEKMIQERDLYRRRVVIDTYVVRLDRFVCLNEQQRKDISAALLEKWDDSWESWLMLVQYEDNYMPYFEDAIVVNRLNPQQRQIYSATSKISFGGSEGSNEFNAEFDAKFWGVEEPKKGAEAEGGEIFMLKQAL